MATDALEIRKRIGQTIVELRRRKGVPQQQICDYSGLSQKYISDIENGKRNLGIDTIVMITNYFNISIGDFFLEVEHEGKRF